MEKYVIEKVIGEGTYGVVFKAKEKVSLPVCIYGDCCGRGCDRVACMRTGQQGIRRDQEVQDCHRYNMYSMKVCGYQYKTIR